MYLQIGIESKDRFVFNKAMFRMKSESLAKKGFHLIERIKVSNEQNKV